MYTQLFIAVLTIANTVCIFSFLSKFLCMQQSGRSRRDCPVPGCYSRKLKRLSNHLKDVHHTTPEEQRKWLHIAKQVSKLRSLCK